MAEKFSFFRSYLDQINKMPAEYQLAAYRAICEYALYDKEPDFSDQDSAYADIVFTGIRPVIDSGKKKARAGSIGGSASAESESKPQAERKQNASKTQANEKQTASDKEKDKEKEKEQDKEQDKEQEQEIKTRQRKAQPKIPHAQITEEFGRLWDMMPKKRGDKDRALAAYEKARNEGTEMSDVLIGINAYKAALRVEETPEKYIPQAATFFTQKRWTNDWTPHRPRDRNAFNQMEQHQYDFGELEEELRA